MREVILPKLLFLSKLSAHLKQAGYDGCFALIHGLTPNQVIGRDFDFITAPRYHAEIVQSAKTFFVTQGFRVVHQQVPGSSILFISDITDGFFAMEIDLSPAFYWFVFPIITGHEKFETYEISGVPCAKWEAFAKRVLIKFLSGQICAYKSKNKEDELVIYANESASVMNGMENIFGQKKAFALERAISVSDWDWFRRNFIAYRIGYIKYALRVSLFGIFPALKWRIAFWYWAYFSKQVTPDVSFYGKSVDLKNYVSKVVKILMSDYYFHGIFIHPISNEEQFKKIKRRARKGQRLMTLNIYISNNFCFPTNSEMLRFNCDDITEEDAVLRIITKHFEMIED